METMQSVLDPGGVEANAIATLSWIMFGGGTVIFLVVLVLAVLAIRGTKRRPRYLASRRFVVAAGAIFPALTLTALLIYGLLLTGAHGTAGEDDALRIEVVGEQWWWRVSYSDNRGNVVTANEIRIPVGRAVEFTLLSADVIHSFWVPNLAGKVDMIPGRINRLVVQATSAGSYRGQCAEFCGGPHALMAFHVIALEPASFERWYEAQRAPAISPATKLEQRGAELFLSSGCDGCHTIRGTPAAGIIGPDLTHVGGRVAIAAATLPADAASFARWIRDNQHIKPNNPMPPFGTLADDELAALGAYLESLQ